MSGEIQLIIGPMFSGKSSELLRRIRRHSVAKKKCLVIKYHKDTRYSQDNLATHDKIEWKALPASFLAEAEAEAMEHEVIGIDEGQFFPDIATFAEEMANRGKIVIVAALSGTFERKQFGAVLDLIPLAESTETLTAVCMECNRDGAAFSKRTSDETQVEVIGGADKYISVCRACYHK